MSSAYVKNFRPRHLAVLRLWAQGYTNDEIATMTNYTPSVVSQITNCPEAKALMAEMQDSTFASIADVQTTLQACAPALLEEKIKLALTAKDERVRSVSCSDLLGLAGHTPVKRVELTKVEEIENDYAGKSDEEIREHIRQELGLGPKATVH